MMTSGLLICLVTCHGGPADHFVVFSQKLIQEGYRVQVYAAGVALKKFQDHQINGVVHFYLDNLSKEEESELAFKMAKNCSEASVVLTDVGGVFDSAFQEAMEVESPGVRRLAYYDNPEPYVPGGYSNVAAGVMLAAQKVLFANFNLAEGPLYRDENTEVNIPTKNRIGLGYYPINQAEKTIKRREESYARMRKMFFSKHELVEKGQKTLVYFGGNNEEYFEKAFPAFLEFLSEGPRHHDLSNFLIVLQQHPGAKNKNRDRLQLEMWIKNHAEALGAPKVIISDETSDDIQVLADGALYYQTSMGPLFALAGIPMAQVGHKTYEDVVVRNKLCPSVTNSIDFVKVITSMKSEPVCEDRQKVIFKSLGIREDWFDLLKKALVGKEE